MKAIRIGTRLSSNCNGWPACGHRRPWAAHRWRGLTSNPVRWLSFDGAIGRSGSLNWGGPSRGFQQNWPWQSGRSEGIAPTSAPANQSSAASGQRFCGRYGGVLGLSSWTRNSASLWRLPQWIFGLLTPCRGKLKWHLPELGSHHLPELGRRHLDVQRLEKKKNVLINNSTSRTGSKTTCSQWNWQQDNLQPVKLAARQLAANETGRIFGLEHIGLWVLDLKFAKAAPLALVCMAFPASDGKAWLRNKSIADQGLM